MQTMKKIIERTHRKPFRPLIVLKLAAGAGLLHHVHHGWRWNYAAHDEILHFFRLTVIFCITWLKVKHITVQTHICLKAWRVFAVKTSLSEKAALCLLTLK